MIVRVAAAVAALMLLLAACGSSATPAPPSTAPVETAAASDDSGLTPPPGGAEAAGATITALNIAFDPIEVTVPAGAPVTIAFDNKDSGIPHNLAVSDANGQIAKTEIVTGPARVLLGLPALPAGTYAFACEVHPNMTGALVVGP